MKMKLNMSVLALSVLLTLYLVSGENYCCLKFWAALSCSNCPEADRLYESTGYYCANEYSCNRDRNCIDNNV